MLQHILSKTKYSKIYIKAKAWLNAYIFIQTFAHAKGYESMDELSTQSRTKMFQTGGKFVTNGTTLIAFRF